MDTRRSAEVPSGISLPDHLVAVLAGAAAPVNKDIRNYFSKTATSSATNTWVSKSEIPSADEIMGVDDAASTDDCLDLVPNIVQGPWPSKDVYLKTHYDLIREDAVAPLRDAVAYFRADPSMMDSQVVSVYEKVHIVGITCAQRGLAFRLRFSTNRAGKNIVWEYSKRLISGSIVALSPASDCFQETCIVAIVAARPLDGVKMQPPEIDIFFARPEDAQFDSQQEFVMVEARSGYYESARYTMAALQKMTTESFPLADQICSLDAAITSPEYVKEDPVVDISTAVETSMKDSKVNRLDPWPELPTEDMDGSQWQALGQMLTRKLAIVQGPPGTGKTHVSVIALKILIRHMRDDDPPIIIAAQTNHALDQLLTHVSGFEPNYIRIGGRSSDMEIKKRTLHAVRQSEAMVAIRGGVLGPARKQYKALSASVQELLRVFGPENSKTPLPATFFMKHGLLSDAQYQKLEEGARDWVQSASEATDPLVSWLGDQLMAFEVQYSAENFGFVEDEVDLEYEQLKELEAEQGIDDEDYETLRGQYMPLWEGFKGVSGPSYTDKAIRNYMRYGDWWQIPVKARGVIYNTLRRLAKEKLLRELRKLLTSYDANCEQISIGKWERDHITLRTAKVVGLTTTGMGKYRALVSSLKPKIVLIEEAAEAIEAPIAVSCVESLQQLILVGDHKQLKGHCSVQELEGEPFFLDVSMFERLVRNGMTYTALSRQRRMAPEIRRLLTPIYGELHDHPSVKDRPKVPGMGDVASFFFCHDWPEDNDSLSSRFNEKEAQMVTEFYLYLILNGLSVKEITVLTFYNGQRKRLLKMLKSHPYLQGHYVKVVTVDSYQGEENEVVILSLVRSSAKGNIGFLAVENRVCVAVSRAKRGLYIFGNAQALAHASPLWWDMIKIMGEGSASQRRLGYHLPLTCINHKRKTFVRDLAQWKNMNGGCDLTCGERLLCGHRCALRCHSFTHEQVCCNHNCGRSLACGHVCSDICSSPHTCACGCETFARLIAESNSNAEEGAASAFLGVVGGGLDPTTSTPTAAPAFAPLIPLEQSTNAITDHDALIQGYHDFANGGVQAQDALLLAKAHTANVQQMQQELDKLALQDLFGSQEENDNKEEEENVNVNVTPKEKGKGKGKAKANAKEKSKAANSPRPHTRTQAGTRTRPQPPAQTQTRSALPPPSPFSPSSSTSSRSSSQRIISDGQGGFRERSRFVEYYTVEPAAAAAAGVVQQKKRDSNKDMMSGLVASSPSVPEGHLLDVSD